MLVDMLKTSDPDLHKLLLAEEQRQRDGLELIASENYVSRAVLEALGTVFTNKYSEGYPGKRYYGGQENTDQIEQIAIDRAKTLFGADHANVQALTGAPANIAVFFAWCQPGDTILGMDLTHGGHLTQGHPVTHMGKLFNFVRYRMKDIETGEIDFDELRDIAKKTKPKIIMAGYSGYPREVNWAKFAEIGREVGALLMADIAHTAGLIAGKAALNPFDAGFHVLTSTTHKTLRGPRGGLILSRGTVSNPLRAPELTIDNIPTLIDRSVFPGLQGGPVMNSVFAKAVAFGEAQRPEFRTYASQIIKNARALADELMSRGFKLITNGTDNHLVLIDMVASFGIDGADAETALDKIGLTTNKNVIPDDTNPPFRPSGLRLGTPAITTRGLAEKDMGQLADWMLAAISKRRDEKALKSLHQEVQEFSLQFPLPSDRD
jgi:glycine hydroxymethyltransferase